MPTTRAPAEPARVYDVLPPGPLLRIKPRRVFAVDCVGVVRRRRRHLDVRIRLDIKAADDRAPVMGKGEIAGTDPVIVDALDACFESFCAVKQGRSERFDGLQSETA